MEKSGSKHLGKRLKKIRAFNGMTQEELAKAINKTRSMVSHIERTGEANYYTLKEIAKVLNMSVEQLTDTDQPEHLVFEPSSTNSLSAQEELVSQLKQEIVFLKDTIQNQWKLLFELSK